MRRSEDTPSHGPGFDVLLQLFDGIRQAALIEALPPVRHSQADRLTVGLAA
ncbi:MAG: hypothetical protein ABII12_13240 [Planctomycetota bacterium]